MQPSSTYEHTSEPTSRRGSASHVGRVSRLKTNTKNTSKKESTKTTVSADTTTYRWSVSTKRWGFQKTDPISNRSSTGPQTYALPSAKYLRSSPRPHDNPHNMLVFREEPPTYISTISAPGYRSAPENGRPAGRGQQSITEGQHLHAITPFVGKCTLPTLIEAYFYMVISLNFHISFRVSSLLESMGVGSLSFGGNRQLLETVKWGLGGGGGV